MTIYRRGTYWHYRFMIDGREHRGTTKESHKGRAQQFENAMVARIREEGADAILRKSPTLSAYAAQFLAQCEREVAAGNLAMGSWKYYRSGWKLLEATHLASMRLNSIGRKDASGLVFAGGPSNANCAFRTLRRLLNSAVEDNFLKAAPRITTVEETGRNTMIEPWMEARLLKHAADPLGDIIVIMADTGMRPGEVMKLRFSDVSLDRGEITIAKSKTSKKRGERHVPISDRVNTAISARRERLKGEWVFPSATSKSGHTTTVKHLWARCLKAAAAEENARPLPANLVLYCGRHTFATDLYGDTKDLLLVQKTLGHADIRTTMKYTHPGVQDTAEIINARNRRKEMRIVNGN